MKRTNDEWAEDADAWFFNLENMAKRIVENERRNARARNRQNATFAFVVFAFLLLAYRSEVTSDRISRNSERIAKHTMLISDQQQEIQEQQRKSCFSGVEILIKYNSLLDSQIHMEMHNKFIDSALRNQRIAAFKAAQISPLPVCEGVRSSAK